MTAAATWQRATAVVRRLPPEFRTDPIDAERARLLLRCSAAEVAQLAAAGWAIGLDDQRRPLFDANEVMTLGLHSGTGRSLPELGSHSIRRLTRLSASALTRPRAWCVTVSAIHAVCPACRTAECDVRVAEVGRGARVQGWRGWDVHRGRDVGSPGAPRRITEVVGGGTIRGQVMTLRNPDARAAVDTIAGDYTYQFLPPLAQRSPRVLEGLRIVDCVGAAHLLATWLGSRGLRVRIGYGLLMFPLGSGVHAWVEVVDDDGVTKHLDPTLVMMTPGPDTGALDDLVRGSSLNVVLPLAPGPLAATAVEHACRCCTTPVQFTTVARAADAAPGRGAPGTE